MDVDRACVCPGSLCFFCLLFVGARPRPVFFVVCLCCVCVWLLFVVGCVQCCGVAGDAVGRGLPPALLRVFGSVGAVLFRAVRPWSLFS